MVYYHFQLQSFFFLLTAPFSLQELSSLIWGKKPVPLPWECWVLTTGPPGKSQDQGFFFFILEWTLQVIEGGAQAISEDKFEITLQHTFLIYWVSRALLGWLVCLVIWTRWWEVLKSRGHWPCFSDEEPEVVWNVGMGPGVVSLAKEAG